MVEIDLARCPVSIPALFDRRVPDSPRLFSVLAGRHIGRVLADDATTPTWCVLREAWFGTTFMGGTVDLHSLIQAITELRKDGQVVLNLDDKHVRFFPAGPRAELPRLKFSGRISGESHFATLLQVIPLGCKVCKVDQQSVGRCLWYDNLLDIFGSVDRFLAQSLGFCLMKGDEVLSEAHAFFWGDDEVEIGTITHENYRGLGYSTLVCAHLVQACEERVHQTYWGCDTDNPPSAAVARKLGYPYESQYTLGCYKST